MKLATGSVGAGLEAKRRHHGDPSHLVQVEQGLVQHPLRAQMLLFGGFQFIWQRRQRDDGYQANRGGFGRGKALAPGWVCGEALGLPGVRLSHGGCSRSMELYPVFYSILFACRCAPQGFPAPTQPAPRGPASRGQTHARIHGWIGAPAQERDAKLVTGPGATERGADRGKGAVPKVKRSECVATARDRGRAILTCFLKPGGELRPATTALGGLDSKGEPAHVTDELHALGRRLRTRCPLGTGGSSKPFPTLPGAETPFLEH